MDIKAYYDHMKCPCCKKTVAWGDARKKGLFHVNGMTWNHHVCPHCDSIVSFGDKNEIIKDNHK